MMTPQAAVDALEAGYRQAIAALQASLRSFAETGQAPSAEARAAFRYPELRLRHVRDAPAPRLSRAYAHLIWPGDYAISITQPRAFRAYLLSQLSLLVQDYGAELSVGASESEIPYSFALEGLEGDLLAHTAPADLARCFPCPRLADVGDAVVDGEGLGRSDGARPLALFDAPRVDYSLKRLDHYTGAPWGDVQPWILFTNYQRYVEEFVHWGVAQVRSGPPGTILSCPGRVCIDAGTPDPIEAALSAPWRKYQMPAYHLKRPDRDGVTLVNIGVGPSNAKTITDHLAVLRPHCWLMVGHCGGLRHSQRVGDYVLAHAYLRRDKVLDERVALDVPIPPIAEVQVALQQAALAVAAASNEDLEAWRRRLRTGTVVSYADRNWELNFRAERQVLSQSRAVAVDMESACIATQGFRMRVPYGVLLCVSDKPLHGEIKLPGSADRFYEAAISQHLGIGLDTIALLQRDVEALHSRKLRSFDEPPFR
jgi:AMP nucleosidase